MDSREPWRVGKMCASRAAMGKVGKFRVAVCVLIMTWPSGSETERPFTAGWMSRRTEILEREIKCPVVPVSALMEWVEAEETCC